MASDDLPLGEVRIWPGQGVARVVELVAQDGVPHAVVDVRGGELRASAPVASVAAMRRPLDAGSAEAVWARLQVPGDPDPRPFDEVRAEIERAALDDDLVAEVEWLRVLHATPTPSVGHQQMRVVLDGVVLSELGHVLGHDVRWMQAELSGLPAGRRAPAADIFGLPGPIWFQGHPHELRWIGTPAMTWIDDQRPAPHQEYCPPGHDPDSFGQKIGITNIDLPPTEVMKARARSLDRRSEIDPITNYQAVWDDTSPGVDPVDICLDYLVSFPDGSAVEWTVERLVAEYPQGPTGRVFTVRFLVCRRAFGDGIRPFLEGLAESRARAIADLRAMEMPRVAPP